MGILLFVVNVVVSAQRGQAAGNNPWSADSLEWATTSPPPNYGFAKLPNVDGRSPLWQEKNLFEGNPRTDRLLENLAGWPLTWRAALTTTAVNAQPREVFRVAGPSIFPLVTAVGLITIFAAEVFSLSWITLGGAVILIGGLIGWHWPDTVPTTERELAFEREHNMAVWPNGSPRVNRWAMALLVLLFAIALGDLLFTYYYLRMENPVWPPAGTARPQLLWAALSTAAVAGAMGATIWARRQMRHGSARGATFGLGVALALALAATGLIVVDFLQLPFTYATHAYGSVFYLLGGFLVVLLLCGIGQTIFTFISAWRGRYSAREHVGLEIGAFYWIAALWLWLITAGVMYATPYLS